MKITSHQAVLEYLRAHSTPDRPIYLVGGAVRDLLINRPVHDLDFVLPGPTYPLAKATADALGGGLYVMDEERDTTRVVLYLEGTQRLLLDFATLRASDLEGDLGARDFTINALSYDVALPDRLIDPTGGLNDLRNKIVRACSSTSLQDDPVRVLRAVRMANGLGFRIEAETIRQVRAAAPLLTRISPERQRDEILRILGGSRVSLAIQVLDQLGALRVVLPEMEDLKGIGQSPPHVADAWEHTLAVVAQLEEILAAVAGGYDEDTAADLFTGLAVMRLGRYRTQFEQHLAGKFPGEHPLRALLFFSALYHDIAKPRTRTEEPDGKTHFLGHAELGAKIAAGRARALALSGDEVSRIGAVVKDHMRCHFLANALVTHGEQPSRRAIFRFFRDTGEAGVDICLLSLADLRATYGFHLPQEVWVAEIEICRALLEAYWEQREQVVSPPRFVSGSDLIEAFGLVPGPQIGSLLDAIRESQASGEITSRAEALDFAQKWLDGSSGLRGEG
jgi:putative nucleotidyltransferase with HDIG domain